mmetsp:Transcript_36701/g.56945  ORF Transcript_36701/g.56945 Transcript_36701/m.56945 type:complete len:1326 (-) Transcript_36701:50-4027(-)
MTDSGEQPQETLKTAPSALSFGAALNLSSAKVSASMRDKLLTLDANGDGMVDVDEVVQFVERESKMAVKLKYRSVLLKLTALVLVIVLGVNMGLTAAVVYLSKDTSVSTDGVMRVKNADDFVQVASVETTVVGGRLTDRETNSSMKVSVTNQITFRGTPEGSASSALRRSDGQNLPKRSIFSWASFVGVFAKEAFDESAASGEPITSEVPTECEVEQPNCRRWRRFAAYARKFAAKFGGRKRGRWGRRAETAYSSCRLALEDNNNEPGVYQIYSKDAPIGEPRRYVNQRPIVDANCDADGYMLVGQIVNGVGTLPIPGQATALELSTQTGSYNIVNDLPFWAQCSYDDVTDCPAAPLEDPQEATFQIIIVGGPVCSDFGQSPKGLLENALLDTVTSLLLNKLPYTFNPDSLSVTCESAATRVAGEVTLVFTIVVDGEDTAAELLETVTNDVTSEQVLNDPNFGLASRDIDVTTWEVDVEVPTEVTCEGPYCVGGKSFFYSAGSPSSAIYQALANIHEPFCLDTVALAVETANAAGDVIDAAHTETGLGLMTWAYDYLLATDSCDPAGPIASKGNATCFQTTANGDFFYRDLGRTKTHFAVELTPTTNSINKNFKFAWGDWRKSAQFENKLGWTKVEDGTPFGGWVTDSMGNKKLLNYADGRDAALLGTVDAAGHTWETEVFAGGRTPQDAPSEEELGRFRYTPGLWTTSSAVHTGPFGHGTNGIATWTEPWWTDQVRLTPTATDTQISGGSDAANKGVNAGMDGIRIADEYAGLKIGYLASCGFGRPGKFDPVTGQFDPTFQNEGCLHEFYQQLPNTYTVSSTSRGEYNKLVYCPYGTPGATDCASIDPATADPLADRTVSSTFAHWCLGDPAKSGWTKHPTTQEDQGILGGPGGPPGFDGEVFFKGGGKFAPATRVQSAMTRALSGEEAVEVREKIESRKLRQITTLDVSDIDQISKLVFDETKAVVEDDSDVCKAQSILIAPNDCMWCDNRPTKTAPTTPTKVCLTCEGASCGRRFRKPFCVSTQTKGRRGLKLVTRTAGSALGGLSTSAKTVAALLGQAGMDFPGSDDVSLGEFYLGDKLAAYDEETDQVDTLAKRCGLDTALWCIARKRWWNRPTYCLTQDASDTPQLIKCAHNRRTQRWGTSYDTHYTIQVWQQYGNEVVECKRQVELSIDGTTTLLGEPAQRIVSSQVPPEYPAKIVNHITKAEFTARAPVYVMVDSSDDTVEQYTMLHPEPIFTKAIDMIFSLCPRAPTDDVRRLCAEFDCVEGNRKKARYEFRDANIAFVKNVMNLANIYFSDVADVKPDDFFNFKTGKLRVENPLV